MLSCLGEMTKRWQGPCGSEGPEDQEEGQYSLTSTPKHKSDMATIRPIGWVRIASNPGPNWLELE